MIGKNSANLLHLDHKAFGISHLIYWTMLSHDSTIWYEDSYPQLTSQDCWIGEKVRSFTDAKLTTSAGVFETSLKT